MNRVAETSRIARELSDLLHLGYPVVEALQKVAAAATGEFATACKKVADRCNQGSTFTKALAEQRGPFPEAFVKAMPEADSEEHLAESLERVADLLEVSEKRQTTIRLALVYPQFVLILGILLCYGLFTVVGSSVSDLFAGMSLQLPLPTRVMLSLNKVAGSPLTLIAVVFLCGAVYAVLSGRPGWGGYRLRMPLLGPWISRHQAVMWLSWVDHLLQAGVPLAEALKLAGTTCDSSYQEMAARVAERTEKGDSLAQALESEEFFPRLGWAMLTRLEGQDLEGLNRVPRVLQRELDLTYQRGVGVIEPLALVLVAFLVAFMILSVFLPLYQLIGNLG